MTSSSSSATTPPITTTIRFQCTICGRRFYVTKDEEKSPGLIQNRVDIHGLTHKDSGKPYRLFVEVKQYSESRSKISRR